MKVFVINLVRRPDRLKAMAAQFNRLGLAFLRVPAIDARTVNDGWLDKHFSGRGPLGDMSKGDKCCLISHQRAWAALLSSGDEYGVVLEDDVALDPTAAELLRSDKWIPRTVQLVKLEHFGPLGQRVLIGRCTLLDNGSRIAEMHSRHTGAAAYIVSRQAAQRLLTSDARWSVAVDHALFNPNVSSVARWLRPHQLLPVVARQTQALGGATDIGGWRAEQRTWSWSYIRRELVRAFYEVRLLPLQIARFVSGRGSFVCVRNDALIRAMSRPVRSRVAPDQAEHSAA